MAELEVKSTILPKLITIMQHVGRFHTLNGKEKKQMVISLLLDEIDLPEILEDLIADLIDILIAVENKKLVINPKVIKATKSLFTCCGKRKR